MALGLAATILTACAGTKPRSETLATAGEQELDIAAGQARSLVKEAYATLRRGNVGGLQPLLSDTLFVVGPNPEHVYSGRTEALEALSQIFGDRRKLKVTSRGLVAVSSPSGKSAWVADQLKIDGMTLRLTAVVAEIDELWVIVALEVSVPITNKEAESLSVNEDKAQATSLQGGVDEAAKDIATLFLKAAAAPEQLSQQLADRREVVAIGRAPKEFTRGAKSIRRAWKKALKAHPTMAPRGEMRASVTPDGALGWLAADVDAARDGMKAMPHRYFAIYERSPEGWRMVAMHEAVVTPTRDTK